MQINRIGYLKPGTGNPCTGQSKVEAFPNWIEGFVDLTSKDVILGLVLDTGSIIFL